ncbi:MAG: [protein-PII] uridylyltransferase [Nitrospirales bacterium]|nr:[protein-PII] uridylyltransferase [Nitrospirales bacterium]
MSDGISSKHTKGLSVSPDGLVALEDERYLLRQRLTEGATGSEILQGFSDFMDQLLIARFREVILAGQPAIRAGWQQCCLVALGGYGRRELAPYSDIDVMVLTQGQPEDTAHAISKGVFHRLWDLGFQVGHSVRSLSESLLLAEGDLTICTSLMESRYLVGSAEVFQEFQRKFSRRVLGRNSKSFVTDKIQERKREYAKFGETVFLLEPNVKKSKGGLRDLHLLQWVAQARYGVGTIQELSRQGLIAFQDYQVLQDAQEFLWRVRCWLHLDADRAQDILTFDDQVRLATRFGFEDLPHLLGVEQFMQQYFRHTTGLFDRCRRFLDQARKRSLWERVRESWRPMLIDGKFLIKEDRLSIPAEKLLGVAEHPNSLLQLFVLSQERAVPIDSGILNELSESVKNIPNERFHTEEAATLFRKILARPGRIFQALEAMHRACLLEKLVPAFTRVRGLMQFNQYHKYTVDEHSLFAVREAERFSEDQGLVGEVYRKIQDKDLLHLALLLHDLGKGRPGDHSEVGQEIAQKMADRLQLNDKERQALGFLVLQHLLMSHIAFRRDLNDPKIILTFARKVKSVEMLRKLFVLTIADISAVGPGVMNKWKETLLSELYSRTYEEITGKPEEGSASSVRENFLGDVRDSLVQALTISAQESLWKGESIGGWVGTYLRQFPDRYVRDTPVEVMVRHCLAVRQFTKKPVHVEGRFQSEMGISEYVLIAQPQEKPGIFMKATGVLAALELQVLDAQVLTLTDGTVFDVFSVHDPDYEQHPPLSRFHDVAQEMEMVVGGQESVEQIFSRRRRIRFGRQFPTGRRSTEVYIDNEVSDVYTVIDVFADDKQGLLYVVAKTLVGLGLSTHMARIGTRLDQVVDVFYVTTTAGEKILRTEALQRIQRTIQSSVDTFLDCET